MIATFALIGLVFGSFVNALAWRVHEEKDFIRGRSECTKCGHKLTFLDLIPVLSWIFLKGKCRYCKKKISVSYPLVELLTAAVFVSTAWFFIGKSPEPVLIPQLSVWLVSGVLLVALFLYDLRWMMLPNVLVYPLLALGVFLALAQSVLQVSLEPLKDAATGFLVVGGFFWLLFQLSNGKWLGGGDVKLAAFIGLMLGWGKGLLSVVMASWLGLAGYGVLLVMGKHKRQIPFGPFLITAAYLSLFFGDSLIKIYMRLTGIT